MDRKLDRETLAKMVKDGVAVDGTSIIGKIFDRMARRMVAFELAKNDRLEACRKEYVGKYGSEEAAVEELKKVDSTTDPLHKLLFARGAAAGAAMLSEAVVEVLAHGIVEAITGARPDDGEGPDAEILKKMGISPDAPPPMPGKGGNA